MNYHTYCYYFTFASENDQENVTDDEILEGLKEAMQQDKEHDVNWVNSVEED